MKNLNLLASIFMLLTLATFYSCSEDETNVLPPVFADGGTVNINLSSNRLSVSENSTTGITMNIDFSKALPNEANLRLNFYGGYYGKDFTSSPKGSEGVNHIDIPLLANSTSTSFTIYPIASPNSGGRKGISESSRGQRNISFTLELTGVMSNNSTSTFELIIESSEDVSEEVVMIIGKRSNGQFIVIDPNEGNIGDAFTISYDGGTLNNIRAFVYNAVNNKFYIGRTNAGNGWFMEADVNTKEATLLNDNADDDWDGLADMVVLPDGDLLVGHYNTGPFFGQALGVFDASNGVRKSVFELEGDPCCGMGMVYGESQDEVIIGTYDGDFYINELDGTLVNTLILNPIGDLETIFPGGDWDCAVFQNMIKDEEGNIYAALYNWCGGETFIVKVDLENLEVSLLVDLGVDQYFGLAFIPKSLLD